MKTRDIFPTNDHVAKLGEHGPEYDFNSNHALLIGINEYQDYGYENLECPVEDVRVLREELIARLGFPEKQVHSLVNEEASTDGIYSRILSLRRQLGAQDNLLIYFAGHGVNNADGTGAWLGYDGSRPLLAFSKLAAARNRETSRSPVKVLKSPATTTGFLLVEIIRCRCSNCC